MLLTFALGAFAAAVGAYALSVVTLAMRRWFSFADVQHVASVAPEPTIESAPGSEFGGRLRPMTTALAGIFALPLLAPGASALQPSPRIDLAHFFGAQGPASAADTPGHDDARPAIDPTWSAAQAGLGRLERIAADAFLIDPEALSADETLEAARVDVAVDGDEFLFPPGLFSENARV